MCRSAKGARVRVARCPGPQVSPSARSFRIGVRQSAAEGLPSKKTYTYTFNFTIYSSQNTFCRKVTTMHFLQLNTISIPLHCVALSRPAALKVLRLQLQHAVKLQYTALRRLYMQTKQFGVVTREERTSQGLVFGWCLGWDVRSSEQLDTRRAASSVLYIMTPCKPCILPPTSPTVNLSSLHHVSEFQPNILLRPRLICTNFYCFLLFINFFTIHSSI